MSYVDATPEPVAFGERLRILRERKGMSRPVLSGLLGKSPSWLKQVERGELLMPSLPMLLRIDHRKARGRREDHTGQPTHLTAGNPGASRP